MFRLFRRDREKGAAVVEFAIILPLFLTLVFGIMESGWLFAQIVEVNNAVREGARLAVVDYADAGGVIAETCDRADLSGAGATVTITLNGSDTSFDPVSPESITITMTKQYLSLTGFLDFAFGSVTMSSTAEMRTERPLINLTTGGSGTCS